MKRILFFFLLLACFASSAQVYNNEWIDHSKTYYKFNVGKTGLYRISNAALSSAGLGSAAAEQFQLWRNGVQVPIYTSRATGSFSNTDYIEFWGEMNDGKPDSALYRRREYQLNDKWSLETDTAAYFLTLSGTNNFRLTTTANNVAGNTLPAEPYFLHTEGRYFRDRINNGYAVLLTDLYMYSSAYDRGEGWSSADIAANTSNNFTFSNLFVSNGGPNPIFSINVSGNASFQRRFRVNINGDSIVGKTLNNFDYSKDAVSFGATNIASNTAQIQVSNITSSPNDRMVVHQYELTYARQFNFGGASNFEFKMPASATGNYLQIAGFDYGSIAPVLYDLTNGKRYVPDISTAGILKVVLSASAVPRRLVMVKQESNNVNSVTILQSRTFINYALSANSGNYLIISDPILFTGNGGANPVEQYRAYRNSAEGGGYIAKTILIQDLIDQFGYGIKKNPLGIRNFLKYAREKFAVTPRQVFIIGRGTHYVDNRYNENNNDIYRLNIVPTFGWPASDLLLSADPGDANIKIPIGRLSVISSSEVEVYLKKVREYELAQRTMSTLIKDKAWMKNVVHVIGAAGELGDNLTRLMKNYETIIEDTFFGAKVHYLTKTTSSTVEQINNAKLDQLFEEGISLMTYYGHSSATTLEFNLNNPDQYKNQGKYPMFVALGCLGGSFYNFYPARFQATETLAEKFVLAPDRGMIGFIASSHFGIVNYLDIYNTRLYKNISIKDYGKTIGEIMQSTVAQMFEATGQEDFIARATCEETILHGDPAVRLNTHAKPDYVIEESFLKIEPGFVSIADKSFKVTAKFLNIGKAINQNIVIQVKREYANGSSSTYRDTIPGIRYADSVVFDIPVDPLKDKGVNKLIVTVDADNKVDELFETNNSITKEVFIYEDELRPVYPYNFSIVNKQGIRFSASTANPFSTAREYRVEIDTTELFNSSLKRSISKSSTGGLIEFDPGITFINNVVYYWRVAAIPASGAFNWNSSSFVYLPNNDYGFNQSHYYQHMKSGKQILFLDSVTRTWKFSESRRNLFIRNGVFPTAANFAVDFSIAIDGDPSQIRSVCGLPNIIVNVFDPLTLKPWFNANEGEAGKYGSDVICGEDRKYNFQFTITDFSKRQKLLEFLELIPSNHYVVIRNTSGTDAANNLFVDGWKSDTSQLGSNRSIYHHLYNQGFTQADSFNRPRAFIFTYKKNASSFPVQSIFSQGIYDRINQSVDVLIPDSVGFLTSPIFGLAKAWKEVQWKGHSMDNTDNATLSIIGIKANGATDTLYRGMTPAQERINISNIDPVLYPQLQLYLHNQDNVNHTPYQLDYWRVTYTPVPEGAIAPNLFFSMKETLDVGEPIDFKIAFKNVSEFDFSDSLKIKMVITDRNNVSNVIAVMKHRPLKANDTLHVRHYIDTRGFTGTNTLYVEVNPDNDQPEQYHFNNFVYKDFIVKGDALSPLLDVTFDNVHILNGDIVSAKPTIQISLKDESLSLLLDDTSLVNIVIRDPDGIERNYSFNNDSIQFIPAQSGANNTATINFTPHFIKDGDYELIVRGKDKSNNLAGAMEYKIAFQVINKAMISNMLNYPNPFTTSTAFVFTITGAEVPQNLKIQILTVTGKVVREITKAELGNLHIGRNITEYKWDGTDQYGQKLGNGIYLYRVVTNLNGQSLEKYRAKNDDSDKYFNNGYGKMYLMR
jgi:hypothetical protein